MKLAEKYQKAPHYMQNINLPYAVNARRIPLGFSAEIEQGFIDIEDLVEIARNIVLDPAQHKFARYELVGENISYSDIARTISRLTHEDIQCEQLTPTEFVARAKASGEIKDERGEDSLTHLLLYYDRW